MCNKQSSPAECIQLLRQACTTHQKLYKDAMNGKGVDRHLFGLFVVCKGLGYVSKRSFLLYFFAIVPLHINGIYVLRNIYPLSLGPYWVNFYFQESDFLKDALMMPWTLSTSQQPQQQIAESPDCNLPMYKDKVRLPKLFSTLVYLLVNT